MQKIKNKKRLTNLTILALLTLLVGAAFALAVGVLDVTGDVHIGAPEENYVVWSQIAFDSDPEGQPRPADWYEAEFNYPPGNADRLPIIRDFGVAPINMGPFEGYVPAVAPAFWTDPGVYARAIVADQFGRTRQSIQWEVYFDPDSHELFGVAFATLHARMLNEALRDADISGFRVTWNGEPVTLVNNHAVLDAGFGLELDVTGFTGLGSIPPNPLEPGDFHDVVFTVMWNGIVPADFVPEGPAMHPGDTTAVPFEPNVVFGHAGTLVIELDYGPVAP